MTRTRLKAVSSVQQTDCDERSDGDKGRSVFLGYDVMVTQDMDHWRALVNTAMNIRVS
jgi:hypothetical protein